MKRTLTVLSAALLASAMALPAFAQTSAASSSTASKPAAVQPRPANSATTETKTIMVQRKVAPVRRGMIPPAPAPEQKTVSRSTTTSSTNSVGY